MLKKFYIGMSALMLAGYASWTVMGWESGWRKRDRVPTTAAARAGGSSRYGRRRGFLFFGGGRSRRSYYGSSSGWGK